VSRRIEHDEFLYEISDAAARLARRESLVEEFLCDRFDGGAMRGTSK